MAKRKRSANDSSGPIRGRKAKTQPSSPPPIPEEPLEPVYPYSSNTGIPLTETKPNYELLQQPVPFRENFSLSHSLAQSRNKWLSGAMFTKYWTRPPRGRKLQEGEVNAREKMSKLCECVMVIGPHIFETKLFLVKDDVQDEDSNADDTTETVNPAQSELPGQATSKVTADEPTVTQPLNSTESIPNSSENPPDESTKTEISNVENLGQAQQHNSIEDNNSKVGSSEGSLINSEPITQQDKSEIASSNSISTSSDPVNSSQPTQRESPVVSSSSTSTQTPSKIPPSVTPSANKSSKPVQSGPTQPASPASNQITPNRPATPNNTSITSNPENVQTIYKLQAIARIDRSLSSLMKIVASGSASHEQITEFQGYINRVRTIELKDIPKYFTPNGPVDPDLIKKGISPIVASSPANIKPLNSFQSPLSSSANRPQLLGSATSSQIPLYSQGTAGSKILPNVPLKRGPKPLKAPKLVKPAKEKKPKDIKKKEGDDKLKSNAGRKKKDPSKPKSPYISKKQQKRVTIVFEFKDNPADRYAIPKNSVIEILPTNEVLVSFFLSFPEGGRSATTKELPPGNVKLANDSKPDKTGNHDGDSFDALNSPSETENSGDRTSAVPPPGGDDINEGETKNQSEVYYPLTITIRDIPVKSLPILERSVHRPQDVYQYMQNIIDTGKRAKDWWVWFEIDQRDESLMEKLMQPAKPPENMFVPARVRVYKSKKKTKSGTSEKNEENNDSDSEIKKEPTQQSDAQQVDSPGNITMVDDSTNHIPSDLSKHALHIDPLLFEEGGSKSLNEDFPKLGPSQPITPAPTTTTLETHSVEVATPVKLHTESDHLATPGPEKPEEAYLNIPDESPSTAITDTNSKITV